MQEVIPAVNATASTNVDIVFITSCDSFLFPNAKI